MNWFTEPVQLTRLIYFITIYLQNKLECRNKSVLCFNFLGTIGHVDHGKTTLTAAITKVNMICYIIQQIIQGARSLQTVQKLFILCQRN